MAQCRLEGLLNFQTLVSDLTGMEVANASLLDESTAAAEAMIMFYNTRSRSMAKAGVNRFFAAETCFPQTLAVLKTRSAHLGIDLVIGNPAEVDLTQNFFGALLQYPDNNGQINDYRAWVNNAQNADVKTAVAADLLSLVMLTPPGEWGADAVVGTTQRFGIPMGYGGPHAAFFATRENYKRNLPGRIIGVSVDRQGRKALRMALQTREQHIRRDKATSNICTAQALLAIMAGMYGVYHGPDGLRNIAEQVHQLTATLAKELIQLGVTLNNAQYFDTLHLSLPAGVSIEDLKAKAEGVKFNFFYPGDNAVMISLDETTSLENVNTVLAVFAAALGKDRVVVSEPTSTTISEDHLRKTDFLTHEVFHKYRSETEMMRYLKRLENKDISLTHSMISLGSCTMKLNAASELYPITMPEFANIHPFAPLDQAKGYQKMLHELEKDLCTVTGFDAISLQPNSGAQGEYAGLSVIRAYHDDRGDQHRNIALIPSSAHGTNPASAVMAGMKVVVVKSDEEGKIERTIAKVKTKEASKQVLEALA